MHNETMTIEKEEQHDFLNNGDIMQNKKGNDFLNNSYIEIWIAEEKESIKIKSLHISCRSDQFKGKEDMIGIILYKYDGDIEWCVDDVNGKAGYIYLCQSSKLSSKSGTMVARCYKELSGGADFDDKKWIAESFKIEKSHNKLKYDSSVKDDRKEIEKLLIKSLNKWVDGKFECNTFNVGDEKLPCGAVWSWMNNDECWEDYDINTNEYIESEYTKYLQIISSGNVEFGKKYFVKLSNVPKGALSAKHYGIHFDTSGIASKSALIRSLLAFWKLHGGDGEDERIYEYLIQEHTLTGKCRIVRRMQDLII